MNLEVISKKVNQEVFNEIITKIKDYINYKNLEPDDKLPSERMLSEKFGVSRGNIRETIQKLEFYGILKTIPQSGTFITNIGIIAMNGIIDDILKLEDPDFKSLVETRILLELKTVSLAALRRTDENLIQMKSALDAFTAKVEKGQDAVQEDLLFHLTIAKASGNTTINKLMLLLTPQIITNFEKYHVCSDTKGFKLVKEHTEIYEAIVAKDSKLARERMKKHFVALYEYCYKEE
ncbi:MAG: FadR family transcriptional regulator [Flavobacterium sp.]|nr:FadR family transcriptional regulator [Flavobacterium sp.]